MRSQEARIKPRLSERLSRTRKEFWKQRQLQAMVWPGIIWMAVFSYIPLVFLYIAFTDYRISVPLFENDFVGLKHFIAFLTDDRFWRAVYNTLGLSLLRITIGFCIPIILALLLNELRCERFKKIVQTVSYLPHFISWADAERDLSAWRGNDLQDDALGAVQALEADVKKTGDPDLLRTWRRFTTSDHFYYMCTKFFSDGDVHKYFSPYETPYDAYIFYMNALADLELTVRRKLEAMEGEKKALDTRTDAERAAAAFGVDEAESRVEGAITPIGSRS